MKTNIAILIIIFMLTSCGFVIKERIIYNYYLTATDIPEQLSLTYNDSRTPNSYTHIIQNTVFAVGHNDNYIIAKQHPCIDTGGGIIENKSITNYYILQITSLGNGQTTSHMSGGPMTLEEFEKMRKQLNITNIEFTKVYHDLE
jgi:hypothetical protein